MKKRSEFLNQIDWLNYLGNLFPEMKICLSGTTKDGDKWFSVRYTMLELNSIDPSDKVYTNRNKTISVTRDYFIKNATHRTILDTEIVFDCDDEPIFETAKNIMKKYESDDPICYFTGSKSYHIHIFKNELKIYPYLKKFRSMILSKMNCDSQKGSSNNMIAIEGALHYKSGKPKIEVQI